MFLDSEVIMLGQKVRVVKSDRGRPKHLGNILYVPSSFSQDELLNYLNNRLLRTIKSEYSKLKKNNGFYIVGEINFKLVRRFRDQSVLSSLKGSTIFVREDVVKLSRIDIREILVHELAHIFSKCHNEKFQMAMRYIGGNQRRIIMQL